MAKGYSKRQKTRHNQGDKDPVGRDRGPNTGGWEKLFSGWRGREKYSKEWNSGYNGPGKGTW